MERRQFLKVGIAGSIALVTGATAISLLSQRDQTSMTIDGLMEKIDLLRTQSLSSEGKWSPYKIFIHCAQSVEMSMYGYPEHKSELFKSTVGQIALSVFKSKGSMSHDLDEAIPGATAIRGVGDPHYALVRLRNALNDFKHYNGQLAPHFAYGELSKQDYTLAHAMHFYNHLEEINAA